MAPPLCHRRRAYGQSQQSTASPQRGISDGVYTGYTESERGLNEMVPTPSFTLPERVAGDLANIVETVTKLEYGTGFRRDTRLHRENRVRAIHASLAIEGNLLSLEEVTAVIEGRMIAGKQTEIKEVKNAYEAYGKLMTLDPYSVKDFLYAHTLMTEGLVRESGMFRSGDVGVFDGDVAIHIGARPQFVPKLVNDLFEWARASTLHSVLKSAILHYEIETIHPFSDGNGRMGRLWQTLLLTQWKTIFEWIPMETVLFHNRGQYYQAIEDSRGANDAGPFIEYTLCSLLDAIIDQEKHQVERSSIQISALRLLAERSLSRKELFAYIGIHGDSRSFERNIQPLLDEGLIERTAADSPTSPLQRYRLTAKGRALANGL